MMPDRNAPFTDHQWLEDFAVGDRFEYGRWLMRIEDMLAFANMYDPEPYHTDEAQARALGWDGIIASGVQISAIWRRMSKDGFPNAQVFVSPGWDEIRWFKPVYAGDELHCVTTITEARPLESRDGQGMMKLANQILRGDELISTVSATWFMRRRPE
jgi:acyl dehydratase